MAVRTGMSDLIRQLRQMSQAENNEYKLAGETYWDDAHLQDVLDMYREDIYEEPIYPIPQFLNGVTVYQNYYWANANSERADSGSAIWSVMDMTGSTLGTATYTVDYNAQRIHFSTPTNGSRYTLNYSYYDMNRAAAEVWRLKAANVANRFDIRTDNHDLKRNQLRQNYLDMAKFYDLEAQKSSGASNGGTRMKQFYRTDVNGC
jgi:hypothetical protein